jgi:hypothetical protein
MPLQTFSQSKLLQPYQHKTNTTPPPFKGNTFHRNPFSTTPPQSTPFQFIPLPSTPPIHNHTQIHPNLKINNPFTNPKLTSQNTTQGYRGGRPRGGRRDTRQKP